MSLERFDSGAEGARSSRLERVLSISQELFSSVFRTRTFALLLLCSSSSFAAESEQPILPPDPFLDVAGTEMIEPSSLSENSGVVVSQQAVNLNLDQIGNQPRTFFSLTADNSDEGPGVEVPSDSMGVRFYFDPFYLRLPKGAESFLSFQNGMQAVANAPEASFGVESFYQEQARALFKQWQAALSTVGNHMSLSWDQNLAEALSFSVAGDSNQSLSLDAITNGEIDWNQILESSSTGLTDAEWDQLLDSFKLSIDLESLLQELQAKGYLELSDPRYQKLIRALVADFRSIDISRETLERLRAGEDPLEVFWIPSEGGAASYQEHVDQVSAQLVQGAISNLKAQVRLALRPNIPRLSMGQSIRGHSFSYENGEIQAQPLDQEVIMIRAAVDHFRFALMRAMLTTEADWNQALEIELKVPFQAALMSQFWQRSFDSGLKLGAGYRAGLVHLLPPEQLALVADGTRFSVEETLDLDNQELTFPYAEALIRVCWELCSEVIASPGVGNDGQVGFELDLEFFSDGHWDAAQRLQLQYSLRVSGFPDPNGGGFLMTYHF